MIPSMEQKINSKDDTYLFELSGEHETLPKGEIKATLEAGGIIYKIIEDDFGALVMKAPKMDIETIRNRLALSHVINSHFFSGEVKDIMDLTIPIEIQKGSFGVRSKRIQNFHRNTDLKKLEKKVADCVKGENKVDLENPDNEIRVIISNRGHIGVVLAKIKRNAFEKRKVQNRPYFSPVSLHPRLARALVNLSRVKAGERLLDPFCGTGGVLMEASLIGAKAMGSDIDSKMVEGCKENLEKFKIDNAEVFHADIGGISEVFSQVDAIATDPPYGKSATTNKEGVKSLYERSFLSFSDVLKKEGYLSIVLPDEELIKMGKGNFHLIENHPFRVHRSLTRNFCVFQKH
jgi:tRNA (guanine10-N2)-dimethyltransferase